jgi:hypothetical protein
VTERPRLRADLLAERIDGIVEMAAPDGLAVLQLYEVEAAVACGMDGSRDPSALVVWARLELGLAVTEAEVRAVVAALAGAGCLAVGDADLASASSPFDSMPAIQTAAALHAAGAMLSAEIAIEDVELPEPGPDLGRGASEADDEDDAAGAADEFRDEPTLTTPAEVLARAAEEAEAAAAQARQAVAAPAPAPVEPAKSTIPPPRRDTPRGYEAIAAAVKASVAGRTTANVPRPAPITAPPPMGQPNKRKRESIPPLEKVKTLRPELPDDERPTLSPDADPSSTLPGGSAARLGRAGAGADAKPAAVGAPAQLFTTMRGPSPVAAAEAPRPSPRPSVPAPTAMMPSVGRLPAPSRTLRPEPIDSPTLRPDDNDFDIDHTTDDVSDDASTLPPDRLSPVPVAPPAPTAPRPPAVAVAVADADINSPSDTIGGMVAPRFCMTCGIELLAGVRFCVACGTPVANMMGDAEAEPLPLAPPPPVAAPAPAPARAPVAAVLAPAAEPGPPSYATPRRLEAPAMRTPVAVGIPSRAASQPSPSTPPPISGANPAVIATQHAPMPTLRRRSSLVPILLVAIGVLALAAVAAFVLWQR